MRTVTLYVVRHGHAIPRSAWPQPDDLRPLDDKGKAEAEALADRLAEEPVKRIVSSPAVRCLETVGPLAGRLGLGVERADELLEGGDISDTLDLLHDIAANDGTAVVCTHGDVIPEVLRRLAAGGTVVRDRLRWPKGSTWALEWDGTRFSAASFLPPGA